jgi:hypothetical protein
MPFKDKNVAREYRRKWRKENPDKVKKYQKQYKDTHKKYMQEYERKDYELHKKEKKEYSIKHREHIKEYVNKKYEIDINYKIAKLLRGRITDLVKGDIKKSASTLELLGCSL